MMNKANKNHIVEKIINSADFFNKQDFNKVFLNGNNLELFNENSKFEIIFFKAKKITHLGIINKDISEKFNLLMSFTSKKYVEVYNYNTNNNEKINTQPYSPTKTIQKYDENSDEFFINPKQQNVLFSLNPKTNSINNDELSDKDLEIKKKLEIKIKYEKNLNFKEYIHESFNNNYTICLKDQLKSLFYDNIIHLKIQDEAGNLKMYSYTPEDLNEIELINLSNIYGEHNIDLFLNYPLQIHNELKNFLNKETHQNFLNYMEDFQNLEISREYEYGAEENKFTEKIVNNDKFIIKDFNIDDILKK